MTSPAYLAMHPDGTRVYLAPMDGGPIFVLDTMLDPGPTKTRAQIEVAINDNQRAENAARDRERENTNRRNNDRER